MKTVKPLRLSLITRSFEVKRKFYFGVSTLVFFDLDSGELLPEIALWQFAAEELGKDAAIEAGVPKSQSEFLITGSVYTPNGEPLETCPVTAKIGGLEKTLYVVGDRFWKGREQSKPQPFSAMPLTWEHAYGGEEFDQNPLGKGFGSVETKHGPIQYLPNIESPGEMITKPTQTPEPVSFGPIDIVRPQRFSKAGTYDQRWLKEFFPGYALDMDWTIFNLSAPDQQQESPFRGDEKFALINTHPTRQRIDGKLPGIRARTFVTQERDGGEAFLEIPTQLRTVWFFPHALKGILIFQGSIPSAEDDGADVVNLLIASESLGQDKGIPHYQKTLTERLDKEDGVLLALRDEDLMPLDMVKGETKDEVAKMQDLLEREYLVQKNLRKKAELRVEEARAIVASHGLDPDKHGPSLPPPEDSPPTDIAELPEYAEKKRKEAEEAFEEQKAASDKLLEELAPAIRAAGLEPEDILKETQEGPVGPPDYSAEGEIQRFQEMAAKCRDMGFFVEEVEQWATDEEIHDNWRKFEQAMRDTYLIGAHTQPPAPRLSPEDSTPLREAVVASLRAREPFAYRDLTGADLSNLDLSGGDFKRAFLESADLTGAKLNGSDFTEAVLARADLSGANLSGVSFKGANLAEARLVGATAKDEIDLSEAILYKADLTRVDLRGGRFEDTDFSEAIVADAKISSSEFDNVTFYKQDCGGLSFAGSKFVDSCFVESNLEGADFSDANMQGVDILMCRGKGSKFFRAKTRDLVIIMCESFEESDFRGAHLDSANLRGLNLKRSDFSGSVLNDSDFSEALLEGAEFYRAVAKETLFSKADLRDANLTSVDLFEGDLQKADIRGAKFYGANLYGVNFGRVRSDDATDVRLSNQKKVTIYPLRQEP